ncbi:hypothetical protein BDW68DRAFT_177556 [Aspergillus falconensis]
MSLLRSCFGSRPFPPAEIDGGHLPIDPSVFTHIERALHQNPHGFAVQSTHQPPSHLSALVREGGGTGNGTEPDPNEAVSVAEKETETETCLAWTYTQLHYAALRIAAGLLAGNVQPSTSMLMFIPNGAEFCLLLWTAVILRVTIVCLDEEMLNVEHHDELRVVLKTIRPRVIVVQDGRGAEILEVASRNLPLDPDILKISLSESEESEPNSTWRSLLSLPLAPALSASETESLLSAARLDPSNAARTHSILYTSGTSGIPKGCPLRVSGMSHVLHSQSWLINAENCMRALQQAHPSRGIAIAQTLQTWREGGTVVLTGNGFNAGDLARAVERYGVSFVVLTPAMVHSVANELEGREAPVDSVRTVQVGGDAVTRDILTICTRSFPSARVVVNHGMTEGGGAFIWPFYRHREIPFYGGMSPVGSVALGAAVRIRSQDGIVARGELGELHVSCPSIIPRYLGGVSAESFYEEDGRRWFKTGDVGMMDKQGVVFILGRKKDMINGKVMPAPIESCLEKFTSVQVCVVDAGGPFAVLGQYTGKTETQIRRHVVRTLGKGSGLRGVVYLQQLRLDKFPLNGTHKIVRREVEKAVLAYLQAEPTGS